MSAKRELSAFNTLYSSGRYLDAANLELKEKGDEKSEPSYLLQMLQAGAALRYARKYPQSTEEYRKNWARLIQKIYELDPLTCPKCSGKMKVISVIEDEEVIKKILKHLGLWEIKERPPPKATGPPKPPEYSIDYSVSQLPGSDKWLYVDPQYLSEA